MVDQILCLEALKGLGYHDVNTMATKKRVLVVDDELGILHFVRTCLNLAGYEVIITASGKEALQIVEREKPDIMVLDILMVPMNGFEVLDRLRTFSQMPVIVCTAKSLNANEAMQRGANDFITKPFKPAELESKIKVLLSLDGTHSP